MAFGRETNTDCLFTPRSLRTVTVANKRESQRLVARLRSLNDEMHLKMTHMNFCAKKTKEKLVKIKQEISEKIDPEPEEPTPSSKDQDDYHNAHLDYLLHEDNDPVPSIKQLISYAMEQFELKKEESKKAAAQEDFLNQDSTKDEQLNQSVEPVAHTEETDQTQSDRINEVICEDNALVDLEDNTLADPQDNALADPQDNALADPEIMTVQELKALIVHMCGPEESELNLDSVTECLLPILRKAEVKTSEPQLGKSNEQLILLKQILSTEFPETYVRQEKAALQAMNQEKKLWMKFNSCKPIILPPIHQLNKIKLEARNWDIDTPTQVPAHIKDEEWEQLKYCHYLRPPVTKT